VAGSRTRLERLDHKLVVPLAGYDLFSCQNDGLGPLGVEKPEVPVDCGCGALDDQMKAGQGFNPDTLKFWAALWVWAP
jgi:hypothetical protein